MAKSRQTTPAGHHWNSMIRSIRAGGSLRSLIAGLAAASLALAAIAALAVAPAQSNVLTRMFHHTAASHPNALWRLVHDVCVPDMQTSGNPQPCVAVDLAGGYALVKDVRGATHYLLVPTARVAGIESPDLLKPGSPNYFGDAWAARSLFEKSVGHPVPRDEEGLAINSVWGRSQNQLHIHIDCVQPQVQAALAEHRGEIGTRWSHLSFRLMGHHYQARWIDGEDLGANDPVKLLARADPAARADMGSETLAVIGARRRDGAPGFIALAGHAGDDDIGHGEELLDHGCAVLSAASAGEAR
jgi:CDP-diacylglycerol pyrophosphatase